MKGLLIVLSGLALAVSYPQAAKIIAVKGDPEVFKSVKNEWTKTAKGSEVRSTDKVRCGKDSRADILLDNGHRVRMWPKSEISLNKIESGQTDIKLIFGRIRSFVKKLRPREKFEVKTPVAVCSVRGTDFSVEVGEDNKVMVEVYEGQVAAREELTGSEVLVNPGEFTSIVTNMAPQTPREIPRETEQGSGMTPEEAIKEESKREIFQEISKEDVLSRAAEEIKLAEYQNGKAMIDVSGNRVRLEEYIVRSQPNEFKYVVLNTREDRFDFGKILFTFNKTLPEDLTEATRNMFLAEGETQPALWLTDVVSVMSNTIDQVNEEATGADNQYNPKYWTLGFASYKFSVNNKTWWEFNDTNINGILDSGEISYYNIATGAKINFASDFQYDSTLGKYYYMDGAAKVYFNELTQPSGEESMHFLSKNNYANGQWITADDYVISDEGKIITLSDLQGLSSAELEKKAYESNFERVYSCSAFNGRKIDLVFSAKLLIDSGMLNLPNPKNVEK